jgi:hypothetical protein
VDELFNRFLELLPTLFGLMPEHWVAYIGAAFAILAALRTVLRAVIGGLRVIDLALDGSYDWTWLGEASDWLDKADSYLDRLPVKALGTRSRRLP